MQVSDDEASRESVIPTVFHSAEEQPAPSGVSRSG